jgi:hypothetical protein
MGMFKRLLAPPFSTGARAPRLRGARARALSDVLAEYDRLVAETFAAAKRDEARWRDALRRFFEDEGRTGWMSYEDEVAYTRTSDRWAHLAGKY